ncbi:MAG: hypothetical protein LUI14_08215 [Lachnospiraceae bacterium]|nr:hypothetical protein [Lachnospiraceae bacterium]
MIQYLQENLGISVKERAWDLEDRIPLYLKSGRNYSILQIESLDCLCIRITSDDFKISSYLKHLDKLSGYWNDNIILVFQELSSYQRKMLIQNRIAFIVPESQVYIPFLGMVFKERTASRRSIVDDKLSATAQLLLLLVIKNKISKIRQADITHFIPASPMTISRAVNELIQLNLMNEKINGRERILLVDSSMLDLYQKCKTYLKSPVSRIVYVKEDDVPEELPLAGEIALAEYSMLNPPKVNCYAMWKKDFNKLKLDTVDPNWTREPYAEIQLWIYDPLLLANGRYISELPLALSFENETDERVEDAVETMMENYKW